MYNRLVIKDIQNKITFCHQGSMKQNNIKVDSLLGQYISILSGGQFGNIYINP